MDKIEKLAVKLLESCEAVTLCSITEEGCPRPCVVSNVKSVGFRTIYVTTGLSGHKTVQFQKNPKAGLSIWKDKDSVTLVGKVEIITDETAKKACWSDWMQEHFSGGIDDPEFCVLKFTASEATFWIGGEFQTIRYPQVDSRCGLRCSQLDCKKAFHFDCRGCANTTDAPWGHCTIKSCCEEKGYFHCGECEEFPCEQLNAFAFDTVHGDGTGERLDVCRCWNKEKRKS